MKPCRVCGCPDTKKPQIFMGEDWCCDRHKKIIAGEIEPTSAEWASMDQELYKSLGGRGRNES
jgi:hypothetical protein